MSGFALPLTVLLFLCPMTWSLLSSITNLELFYIWIGLLLLHNRPHKIRWLQTANVIAHDCLGGNLSSTRWTQLTPIPLSDRLELEDPRWLHSHVWHLSEMAVLARVWLSLFLSLSCFIISHLFHMASLSQYLDLLRCQGVSKITKIEGVRLFKAIGLELA